MLIDALVRGAQSGKLDLVRAETPLGLLKRIQITKKEIEENRCLNGEVQRYDHYFNQQYCGLNLFQLFIFVSLTLI